MRDDAGDNVQGTHVKGLRKSYHLVLTTFARYAPQYYCQPTERMLIEHAALLRTPDCCSTCKLQVVCARPDNMWTTLEGSTPWCRIIPKQFSTL